MVRMLGALIGLPLLAQSPATLFEEKIRPLLVENCYACHTQTASGGLRLDSRAALLQGGKSGPAVVPGQPDASLLYQAVAHSHASLKMPPSGKLSASQIADLRAWITDGAIWPETPAKASTKPPLWAAKPLAAAQGSIDELAKAVAPPLDKRALLRRVSVDLTGLAPTYEEVEAFAKDTAVDAYPRAVDRLLASTRYGEHWARHWLDVARYAEDDVRGLGQATYPNAWRYRDWVIKAFQEDLPYDQFVRLQIAADLLPRVGRDDRAALGLFGLGPWYYSNAPPPESRADERHDRVDVLTRGFLGLTVACARCHDHKFDPIPTRDYYALAGVFARSQYFEYPLVNAQEVERWDRHKQRIEETEKAIQEFLSAQARQLSEILAADTARYLAAVHEGTAEKKPNWKKIAQQRGLDRETLERWNKYAAKTRHEHPFPTTKEREFQDTVLAVLHDKKELDEDNEAALAPSKPKRNASKTRLPNGFSTYDEFCPGCSVAVRSLDRDRYMLWSDLFKASDKKGGGGILYYGPEEIERFLDGPWKAHLARLRTELAELKRTLPEQYPYLHAISERADTPAFRIHTRGNAYTLGDVAPQRFLEALGGEPIDQGSGRAQLAELISRHPLAARVAVNRMWGALLGEYIVASPSNFGALGQKPSNPALLEYLAARFVERGYSVRSLIREIALSEAYRQSGRRRRLDIESIRDAMLQSAGLLDAKTGGPSVDLNKDRSRRTIYGKVSRFRLDDMLTLFDFPSPAITSEKRNVTNVAQQNLFFLNSPFVADVAAAIGKSSKEPRTIYRRVLSRDPSAEEEKNALRFLEGGDAAGLAQVLLSSNEFLFVD